MAGRDMGALSDHVNAGGTLPRTKMDIENTDAALIVSRGWGTLA